MSLYRLSASVISRGRTGLPTTRNAVAAASYNAREPLFDERQGVLRDVAADVSELIRADILLPENAPSRWLDREVLWNEVERIERRSDAQLARSIVLTLPRDLSLHENIDLARDFFGRSFVSQGMVADVAIHAKEASDGLPQPHAHALLTMRRIVDGAFGPKERRWNSAAALQGWRAAWASVVNHQLAQKGSDARVDHRAGGNAAWVQRIVAAAALPRAAIRAEAEREAARARHLVDVARPVVINAWRRVTDWAERRSTPMSQQDAVDQLRDALWQRGLRPTGDPIMDGKWHRVAVEGDSGRKASGSYIAHADGRPNGYIQNFRTGENGPWRADGGYVVADPATLAAAQAARQADRAWKAELAQSRSMQGWSTARDAVDHPYLSRKEVDGAGARVTARGDLLVPMRDADGALWGVQMITPNGEKFFPRGGRVEGLHTIIGDLQPGQPVVVVEGWATGKTVHAETGLTVVAAFNHGNLPHVAKAYRDRGYDIVVGADNDHALPLRNPPLPNVGLEKGTAAAAGVGGKTVTPRFALGDAGTDWNDYVKLHGTGSVRQAFEREGIPLGDTKFESSVIVRPETTQAQREAARQMVPLLAQAAVNADLQAEQASQRAQVAAQQAQSVAVAS